MVCGAKFFRVFVAVRVVVGCWLLVVGCVGGEKILHLGGFLFGGGSVFFCVWCMCLLFVC